MQRILEGNLLIGLGARILRNDHLHGLKVEEVERITQLLHELTDGLAVNMRLIRYRTSHLHLLEISKLLVYDVIESHFAIII